jgi:putative endonuclease
MGRCIYKNRLGRAGELIAKDFLTDKGYEFIRSNYRYKRSEIDLICIDKANKILLFVEVKTRRNKKYGEPEESITLAKQESIRKAAEGFLLENEEYAQHDVRIDVLSIMLDNDSPDINHIENAF